jgi:MFS family permease
MILAAYFAHLLGGVTAVSLAPTHLSELGVVSAVAVCRHQPGIPDAGGGPDGRRPAGRPDRPALAAGGAQGMMAAGLLALAHATTWPLMMLFAIGVGVGFGLTVLAVSILLLNYYGRKNNLELFSLVCLVGAVSAGWDRWSAGMRDRLGSFAPTFQVCAAIIGVNLRGGLFHAAAAQSHRTRAGRRTGPQYASRRRVRRSRHVP